MEGFQKNEVPGFLIKTYRLVDDSDTDDVISWSKDNKSFIVWSPITFAEELLPKHFKHNNFSSFIRQLNTYGFRKIDPDRFEFANERFARDQPHLMKEIVRRKYDSRHHSQQPLGTQQQFETGSRNFSVEVGNFGGLKEEIERFKRDKNILLKEVVKLRQQQQANQRIMQVTKQRLRRTEQVEQQMMSFLAKAVESPDVLAQLVRQTQQNKRVQKGGTLTRQGNSNSSSEQSRSKGQIIKYHSNCNDNVRPKLLDQILRFSSLSHLPISSTGTSNSGELRNFDPVPSDLDNAFLSTVQENPTNVLPREKVHGQSPQIGLIETSDTVFVNENETVHSNYCQAKFELAASGVDSASSDMMVKAMHVEEPKLQNPSDFPLDRISRDVLPCDVVNGESQMGLIETSDHTASVNETETDHLNHCQTTIKIPASGVDIASSDMMVKGMHTEEPNPSDWLLDLLYSDISSLDLDDLLPDLDFPEIVGTGF